jgi:hypothetical protein
MSLSVIPRLLILPSPKAHPLRSGLIFRLPDRTFHCTISRILCIMVGHPRPDHLHIHRSTIRQKQLGHRPIAPTHKPPSTPESPPPLLPQHPKNQRQIIHRRIPLRRQHPMQTLTQPPRRCCQVLKPDRYIHQIPQQQLQHVWSPIQEYGDHLAI